MLNDKFNGSRCKDLTAYKAITKVARDEKKKDKDVSKLIQVIKFIIENAGYEVVNRIVIMDKETKKVYR